MKSHHIALVLALVATGLGAVEGQVTDLAVRHQDGQTFITWREVDEPALQHGATVAQVTHRRKELAERRVRYRVYRSASPITSLDGMKPIGGTGPLSCWNTDFHGRGKDGTAPRWVAQEGAGALEPGIGIYVHNPGEPGDAYYAVTYGDASGERVELGAANSCERPVAEAVGQGAPVLQRVVGPKTFQYIDGATLRYYVRWEAPPNASVENVPIDYLLAIPPGVKEPWVVGLHLHCWSGSLNNGYGWWDNALSGAVLLASNQVPYDWWTGYNDALRSGAKGAKREAAFRSGVVRPYSMTRMFSFYDWLCEQRPVDRTRTFVSGISMGGSGAVMCALRYPDRIAYCRSWVGVHIPAETPRFRESYEGVYGKREWGIRFEDGTPVWDYYDDVWYLENHPEADIGFIAFSNGKNDGGIGWPQAASFARALQETKRPHLFVWGQEGHSQRAIYPRGGSQRENPIDVRLDQSLPAFTGCSLDGDVGTGSPQAKGGPGDGYDGDAAGQLNRWLYWETDDVEDTPTTWAMTLGLMAEAPASTCTVDVTPRRLQSLQVEAGDRFTWTNQAAGEAVQHGEVAADERGLVTIPGVEVGVQTNRITLLRQ